MESAPYFTVAGAGVVVEWPSISTKAGSVKVEVAFHLIECVVGGVVANVGALLTTVIEKEYFVDFPPESLMVT